VKTQQAKQKFSTTKKTVKNVIVGLDDKWAPPTDPLEMVITNPEKT
jgi:hypothetical protein